MEIHVSSITEASKVLNISRKGLYERIKSGKIIIETFYKGENRAYKIYQTSPGPELTQHQTGTSVEKHGTPGIKGGEFVVPKASLNNKHGHARFIQEWLDWYSDGVDVNAWTDTHKRDRFTYIVKYFERYERISAENLRQWLAQVDKNRVTLRRHMHGAVSSYARFLCERKQLLPEAEREAIRRLYPKVPRGFKRERKIIYREQLSDILAGAEKAAGDDAYKKVLFKTLIIVLATTALRLSEVCSLKLSNIRFNEDLQKATITVVGKGGKEWTIPFPKLTQEYILEYLAIRPHRTEQEEDKPDALFWVYSPRYGYTTLKKYTLVHYIRDISEASGIEFTAHSFRHYRITMWMDDGHINPSHAQLWAGHSDLKTTQGYTHIRDVDALASAYRAGYDELGLTQKPKPVPQAGQDPMALLAEAVTQLTPQQKAQLLAKMVGA